MLVRHRQFVAVTRNLRLRNVLKKGEYNICVLQPFDRSRIWHKTKRTLLCKHCRWCLSTLTYSIRYLVRVLIGTLSEARNNLRSKHTEHNLGSEEKISTRAVEQLAAKHVSSYRPCSTAHEFQQFHKLYKHYSQIYEFTSLTLSFLALFSITRRQGALRSQEIFCLKHQNIFTFFKYSKSSLLPFPRSTESRDDGRPLRNFM